MLKKKLTKRKKCKHCGKPFDQSRFGQVTCYTSKCAIGWMRTLEEKKIKRKKTQARVDKIKGLQELKSHKDWQKELQPEINTIARLIDKEYPCMMCGNPNMKRVNGCHYHAVGANNSIRFNLLNVWAGCHKCNSEDGGNLNGYDKELINTFGRDFWEYIKFGLVNEYPFIKLTIPELREKIALCRMIIRELKKEDKVYILGARIEKRREINKRIGIY